MPGTERIGPGGADTGREDAPARVEVVLALPRWQQCVPLVLQAPLTAREAVLLAVDEGLDCTVAGLDPHTVPIGIFGDVVADDHPLQPGDRVELYRPLLVDPRERRRRRAAQRPAR